MQRALTLARSTIALASPNPQVGCVLTHPTPNGPETIGEGAHLYSNRDHAEIVALKQARARNLNPAGATAFVTLEPCAHQGRTPPCADALIAARVARVVVATADPNPLVAGQGLARLRSAGIEVQLGLLKTEARQLNDAWAFSITHHRPFVTLKSALSVDGYLAPPPHTRSETTPFWLTGPTARAHVQQLRHNSDAILTGIGTILADNPLLTDRTNLPRRRPLLRIVLDPLALTPSTSALIQTANRDLLLLTAEISTAELAARIAALQEAGAETVALPTLSQSDASTQHRRPRLDLHAALAALNQRRSPEDNTPEPIRSVLLETGSALNGAFLAAGLVDQLALFYAERELGPGSIPFARDIASPHLLEHRLSHITRHELRSPSQTDALVTGYFHDPWT